MKNTAHFAASNFAAKLISFILIPLYTFKLTTSEYGIADLLFTICTFLYPLLTLNISEAIFRFSMDKEANKKKIVNIGLVCFLISVILGIPVALIFKLIPDCDNYSLSLYTYLISMSAAQILLALMKGRENLKVFTAGNILNAALTVIFSAILLIGLDMKVPGFFLAYTISNILTTLFIVLRGNVFEKGERRKLVKKGSVDKALFLKMAKYSVVLIPTSFMWWIINSSDKIMITALISASANGLYAIAYKIPSLVTLVATVFNQAWVFSAVSEKDSADREEFTNRAFGKFFGLLTIFTVTLIALSKLILRIFVASEYYDAWIYVPPLLFGFVFMTLSTFISSAYNVHKDSKGFLISGSLGALVNIIFNLILIPSFGAYGAAIGTVISYIAVFVYRLIDTRKYVKIHPRGTYGAAIAILALACGTAYLPTPISLPLQLCEIAAAIAIYWPEIKSLTKPRKKGKI